VVIEPSPGVRTVVPGGERLLGWAKELLTRPMLRIVTTHDVNMTFPKVIPKADCREFSVIVYIAISPVSIMAIIWLP
jgi:hypothetical protein